MASFDAATADWDRIPIPPLAKTAAVAPRAGCVFPTCDTIHGGGATAHSCHTCGRTTVPSCLRKRIPTAAANEWLEMWGEVGWTCPVCTWEALERERDEADAEMWDGEEYDEESSSERVPAPPPKEDTNAAALATILQEIRELRSEVTGLRGTVEEQKKEIAELKLSQKKADQDLPAGFTAHVVSTWGDALTTASGQRLVKAEVTRVFRKAELESGPDAPDWHHEMASRFERVYEMFDLIKQTNDVAPFVTPLHKVIVEMNSYALLRGRAGARHYQGKAKALSPSDYTVALHRRFIEEGRAKQEAVWAKAEAKAEDRSEPYRLPSKGRGRSAGKGRASKGLGKRN